MRLAIGLAIAALIVLGALLLQRPQEPARGSDAPVPARSSTAASATDDRAVPREAGPRLASETGAIPMPGDGEADTGSADDDALEQYRAATAAARRSLARAPRRAASTRATGPRRSPFQPPGRGTGTRVQRAWEDHVAPLLHGAGHPRAGEPLEGVTARELANAADEVLRARFDESVLDAPRRALTVQQRYETLQGLVERHGTGRDLADALADLPADPTAAPLYPYWIATDADDPAATSYRDFYGELHLREASALVGDPAPPGGAR